MNLDGATVVLVAALALNAVLGFGYRVYRLTRGGPMGDVVGQAVLALLLLGTAAAVALGASWARWVALAYALLFGIVVMPLWTLAVYLPLRPGAPDHAFAATYWVSLGVVAVTALLA